MKIVISADYDLYFAVIINSLLPYLKKHQVKIIISNESGKGYGISELQFFEHEIIKNSIFPFLDKNNITCKYLTFKQISDKYKNIQFIELKNINNEDGVKIVKEFEPDVLLSIRNRVIFKKQIISIPKYGIINIHPARLPEYRGLLTMLRIFNNKEKMGGCTIHYISDMGIDTGDIINIINVPIDFNKSLVWNILNIYEHGVDSLISLLIKLENKEQITTASQKKLKGNYYSYPTKQEIFHFLENGHSFLSPEDCIDILNRFLKK